uniref:Secreted protein n=1 Tax=Ascaris lumbricoides TaxID=6252 RepID=A0A0M3IK02_ASCLU
MGGGIGRERRDVIEWLSILVFFTAFLISVIRSSVLLAFSRSPHLTASPTSISISKNVPYRGPYHQCVFIGAKAKP